MSTIHESIKRLIKMLTVCDSFRGEFYKQSSSFSVRDNSSNGCGALQFKGSRYILSTPSFNCGTLQTDIASPLMIATRSSDGETRTRCSPA